MTLAELLDRLEPTSLAALPFPRHLLGAFRRKSITLCTGVTDETTVVYWFQSRSFTIDLRLPDGAATVVDERQGWVGDTHWDKATRQLSWTIASSYQPRNQWPEPAILQCIGNSVIEFAPSGAYVEDWRQQASTGPLLGLRLKSLDDEATGQTYAMEGGLILAGTHAAYAQARLPHVERAVVEGTATEDDIASYEVTVQIDGGAIRHSTRSDRVGDGEIAAGDFTIDPSGAILQRRSSTNGAQILHWTLDCYVPEFVFANQTEASPVASDWIERESDHLMRHAVVCR